MWKNPRKRRAQMVVHQLRPGGLLMDILESEVGKGRLSLEYFPQFIVNDMVFLELSWDDVLGQTSLGLLYNNDLK